MAGCDSAIRWLAEPSLHVIENVGSINTPMSEFGPYRIGEELFFTAEPNDSRRHKVYGRTGNAFLKVYKAPLVNGSTVVDSHPVSSHWNNQNFHVGPLSSNKEGNILFITRTYPGKKGERSSENEFTFYTQRLELIIASKTPEGDWEEAAFPYNDIKSFSTGHAALSPDEKVLYFVSDRPGGLGGTDIWYSERLESGEWGPPIVAGSKINSPGNEMFPVMDAEGTLFFSSDGFAGMGGLDIFKSKGERNLWSKPENLKFPINEAGDDFAYFNLGIVEGQETGFFSSNRKGGEGGDDVYRVRKIIPKRKLVLLAKTYNKENNTSLEDVAVHLIDSNKNLLAKRYSSSTGVVEFPLEQIGLYTILGQKEGFYPDSAQADAVFTLHQDTLYASLYLEPLLTIGKTITLENIYYDFDKHAIRKDAAEVLDLLVGVLRDNPQMKIELGSHTDSRGPDEYNQLLSQRRAQSAVDYLVQHGISRSRLTAKGYGESQLVNRCKNGVACSIQEHQENRRTTFTILSY